MCADVSLNMPKFRYRCFGHAPDASRLDAEQRDPTKETPVFVANLLKIPGFLSVKAVPPTEASLPPPPDKRSSSYAHSVNYYMCRNVDRMYVFTL